MLLQEYYGLEIQHLTLFSDLQLKMRENSPKQWLISELEFVLRVHWTEVRTCVFFCYLQSEIYDLSKVLGAEYPRVEASEGRNFCLKEIVREI